MSIWMELWLAFILAGGLLWFWFAKRDRGWKMVADIGAGSFLLIQVVTRIIEHYMEVPK